MPEQTYRAIRLRTRSNLMPRRIYLVSDVNSAKMLFNNCFLIKNLPWWKISKISGQITKFFTEKNIQASVQEYLSTYFSITVVPLSIFPTPALEGNRQPGSKQIKELIYLSTKQKITSHNKDFIHIAKMFQENSDGISVILGGELYLNPCDLCENKFKAIHGECSLFPKDEHSIATCHFGLIFKSTFLKGKKVDPGIKNSKAKVNDLVQSLK